MKGNLSKGLTLILALVLCLSVLPSDISAQAYQKIEESDYLIFKHTDGRVEYVKYTGSASHVTIPSGVTHIACLALGGVGGNDAITEVTIPDSVIEIGVVAFSGCTALKSIVIPDSVVGLGSYIGADMSMSNLRGLVFAGCTNLESVTLGKGITEIPEGTFKRCKSLKGISIPENVTHIGAGAFSECTNLQSIVFPDSVTQLGDSYGDRIFSGCTSLESVTFPNNDITFDQYLLKDLPALKSLTIPENVKPHNGMVAGTLPVGVTIRGYSGSVIEACAILDGNPFISLGEASPAARGFDIENGVLKNYTGWIDEVVIPDSVTSIGERTFGNGWLSPFKGWGSIVSVVIPDSVTSIGNYAFAGCSELKSITIPKGVTSIGSNAFSDTKIEKIEIPDSVTSIGEYAFYCCSELKIITIPKGVTNIGEGAFGGTIIEKIEIPDSVTSIGGGAFSGTKIVKIEIPDSVTSIGDYAFNYSVEIHGMTGSYAETYAKEYNYSFVSTGGATPTPTDPTPPAEAPNLDSASGWAHESLNQAYSAGLVPTELQSKYSQATTRAEFCALAVALYETVTSKEITERATFNDTNDVNVEKMAGLAVVNGVGGGNFAPDTTLTREQAATLLSRLANVIGKPLAAQAATFNDNAQISSWAIDAVGQMQAAGIMGGVGENTFAPKNDYAREQSITTILRLYNAVAG